MTTDEMIDAEIAAAYEHQSGSPAPRDAGGDLDFGQIPNQFVQSVLLRLIVKWLVRIERLLPS
jgi:hypothetical protein